MVQWMPTAPFTDCKLEGTGVPRTSAALRWKRGCPNRFVAASSPAIDGVAGAAMTARPSGRCRRTGCELAEEAPPTLLPQPPLSPPPSSRWKAASRLGPLCAARDRCFTEAVAVVKGLTSSLAAYLDDFEFTSTDAAAVPNSTPTLPQATPRAGADVQTGQRRLLQQDDG